MTPELSAVVVSHRSAQECAGCVGSLREAFEREGIRGEIVLVDCGSGPEEVERLSGLGAEVFLPLSENRGYSGGANAGLARARGGALLVSNADVVFQPGALTALLETLADPRVGAAAPLAFWDAEGRLLLPPGDPPGFFSELARLFAGRSPRRDERRFARFARETVSLWRRGGTARQLVGAVLAARREVFDAVGRFDERFPFEYEETEWEERVRGAGLELCYVARARVRHLWGRSASRSPEAASRREASRRLYRQRRYGTIGRKILEASAGASRPPAATPVPEPAAGARPGAWLALSPNPARFPFAGVSLSSEFCLPREVREAMAPMPWYLTVFGEEDGGTLETLVWRGPS